MPSTPSVVRVSSKYQIVIPLEVREAARITPGTEFEVRVGERDLRLIRIRPLAELRGTIRRDDSIPIRDKRDRV